MPKIKSHKGTQKVISNGKIGHPGTRHNTGKKNEFGEDIIVYEATVVLIDSIPSLSVELNDNDKKDLKKIRETKRDVYFHADEAIELGIANEIIGWFKCSLVYTTTQIIRILELKTPLIEWLIW